MAGKRAKNHSPSSASAAASSLLVSTRTASSTDLISKILSKLPVKSVCKFKSVSKQWLAVVSNPYFIALHEEFTLLNPKILVLKTVILEKRTTRIDIRSLKLDGSCAHKTEFSFYLNEDKDDIHLVYSKFGFICFASENRFYACNPSKREMFLLPYASVCVRDEVNAGIGYVKESNEYVLVHLFLKKICNFRCELRCEVLRLRDCDGKDCEWKVIDAKCPCLVQGLGVFVNNVFYWKTEDYSIVSFDLVKEEFGLVSPPEISCTTYLVELGGSLCMVHDITSPDIINIWVLKDYVNHDWVLEYRIDISEFSLSFMTIFDIFDCWNGKIWIWVWVDPTLLGLVYYDVEKGCIVKVEHPNVVDRTWLVLYTERLLFSIGTR